MPGLVLKLRDGERVLVNGAVIEAAGRGCRLRVLTPDTHILRMRDAIDPARVETPVGRLTHLVQMMVAGSVPAEAALAEALDALDALEDAFVESADRHAIRTVRGELESGRPYPALRALATLRDREALILRTAPMPPRPEAAAG